MKMALQANLYMGKKKMMVDNMEKHHQPVTSDGCPGVRALLQPSITVRSCPKCGEELEFFEFDVEVSCPKCGHKLRREVNSSCITWCQYTSKCIADLREKGLITPAKADELEKLAKAK